MELHTGSQALKVPPKIAISHVFVILGGNILRDKAQELFLFSFLGRVPVIFLKVYVTVLLLKKYLTIFYFIF